MLIHPHRRYLYVMRRLRYSISVTLDGCCDHRVIPPDEELHRHAIENFDRADALLFGRVIYEMMEAAWRPPAGTVIRTFYVGMTRAREAHYLADRTSSMAAHLVA